FESTMTISCISTSPILKYLSSDTSPTSHYTLSLHDALPISAPWNWSDFPPLSCGACTWQDLSGALSTMWSTSTSLSASSLTMKVAAQAFPSAAGGTTPSSKSVYLQVIAQSQHRHAGQQQTQQYCGQAHEPGVLAARNHNH